jgi:peroxiredoxin
MAAGRGVKVAIGAVAIGLAAAAGLAGLGQRGPRLAPDFAVTDLQGRTVRLSALRGNVVVLNLWTTWCPPCREEMPSMERLYTRLRGKRFSLLAVSQDEDGRKAVEPFVRELGLSFPVLVDPERQVGERYGVWGYPETFVIDRNGYVVERVIGPRDWASPAQVATLEALIAADAEPDAASAARALHGPS